ncbi:MAG: hypothetical protein ACP5GI_05320 [Sulfolobales archaeon]
MSEKEISRDMLIEQLARKIVDSRLETISIFFLETVGPLGRVWSQLALLYLQPLLILLGSYGDLLIEIIRDPEAVKKLVKRIEELAEDRDRRRKK